MKGIIYKIFPTNQVTDKFSKREFVLLDNDNPQYPQHIKMEFVQDKCSLLDQYNEGDSIEVEFNINGREYKKEGKEPMYFVTLQAWKIAKVDGSVSVVEPMVEDDGSNLPF